MISAAHPYMTCSVVAELLAASCCDPKRHEQVAAMPEPRSLYLIAMTPRSGSSHLCDVLSNTRKLGRPGEMLSKEFIPEIVRSAPGRDADEYLRQVLKVIRTPNGVSGLKASWFQFDEFRRAMKEPAFLLKFRFIHLTRRDPSAQAVSLYRATATNVFHTNVHHSADAIGQLEALDYDFEKIRHWHDHIVAQERGWQSFFAENGIFPLAVSYEDIEHDVLAVVRRIAAYIGRPHAAASVVPDSIFRKLGERRSLEWATRFKLDLDAHLRAPVDD